MRHGEKRGRRSQVSEREGERKESEVSSGKTGVLKKPKTKRKEKLYF